jgi:hypothetical protein
MGLAVRSKMNDIHLTAYNKSFASLVGGSSDGLIGEPRHGLRGVPDEHRIGMRS